MNIDKIEKNGFYINKTKPRIKDIAILSLNLSLKAYFSTYKSISSYISILNDNETPIDKKNLEYSNSYIENATEAIFHFQHFVELVIKEILRNEHELLTIDTEKQHLLLYDLLKNKEVNEADINKTRQVEFREALERLVCLIKKGRLSKEKYGFISDASGWLYKINYLRNRIAHRGVFILQIDALDFLFGKYVFPFIINISTLEGYDNIKNRRYQNNELKINPIERIIQHFENGKYSMLEVALLKEIGRASYLNPTQDRDIFNQNPNKSKIRRAELIAKHTAEEEFLFDAEKCPICGIKSFIKYQEIVDLPIDEDDDLSNTVAYIHSAKCYCCSFEVYHSLRDLDTIEKLEI